MRLRKSKPNVEPDQIRLQLQLVFTLPMCTLHLLGLTDSFRFHIHPNSNPIESVAVKLCAGQPAGAFLETGARNHCAADEGDGSVGQGPGFG